MTEVRAGCPMLPCSKEVKKIPFVLEHYEPTRDPDPGGRTLGGPGSV